MFYTTIVHPEKRVVAGFESINQLLSSIHPEDRKSLLDESILWRGPVLSTDVDLSDLQHKLDVARANVKAVNIRVESLALEFLRAYDAFVRAFDQSENVSEQVRQVL